jgi:hypothetical protein
MSTRELPVIEDPDRPGWMLYRREEYEIDKWLEQRQKRFLSRLLAIQVICTSLLWMLMHGR